MIKTRRDAKFDAILAKNRIARELADLIREGKIRQSDIRVILEDLTEIEDFIGEGNQPIAEDIIQVNSRRERQFTI